MITRLIVPLSFVVLLAACATVKDGEYVQKAGAGIDYQKVDGLITGVSTMAQAIGELGEPSRRYAGAGDVEMLEYVSVKTRGSQERTLGISHGYATQSLHETLTLTFEHGVLLSKKEKSAIDR